MFGNNKILGAEPGDGSKLKVHSIFETIQGEGPYAGFPSVFIRLSGCNLSCSFCDTEFESYELFSIENILNKVNAFSRNVKKLIVISGGEPLRQQISPLCNALMHSGFKIQIETNGLLYRDLDHRVDIICSPKNTGNGYSMIREDIRQRLVAIKFLISMTNKLYFDIAEVGQTEYNIPVFVQPMDEYDDHLNKMNCDRAISVAKQHNVRLSLQLHKILGID